MMTIHEAWGVVGKLWNQWCYRQSMHTWEAETGKNGVEAIRASMLQDLRYRRDKPVFASVTREIRGQLVQLGKARKVLGR